MKSQNFEFLRAKRAVLADLAGFAERYAHEDPASSLIKQRSFVEHAVAAIYTKYRLQPPFSDNLNDLMTAEPFRQSVPEVVQNKLHAVRKGGNHAAHPRRPITSQLSLSCLAQLFDIARWFHVQVDGGDRQDAPAYVAPPPEPGAAGKTREALEKLRLAEAKYESVLAALEEETRKRLDAERAATEHATELAGLKAEGQNVASLLQFNEETTRRRLIDHALLAAGWDVGPDGKSTAEVGQEVPLSRLPTDSGVGVADYVLYGDDGKPLAVIEAKRTAKEARAGAEQARMYAHSLEQESGVRPVIFYTNGVDIFLWDDAQKYPWRKVYGFYSKDSLEYLTHQRTNKKPLAMVEPNLDIANRMYQLEAVKQVCERFTLNFRKALLVQATGTGKTRVAISLCDVLMRAGWVKRILFLCDRRELRRQADRVFKEFMPGEPRVVVDSTTSGDRDKRIYLATYPAMMKCFEEFDVGFFDLIIADESHRSIYKKFRALFQYFDALEVGLTATPVRFIERNTYELFGCEDKDPTSHFSYDDAVNSKPPFLVPFRVRVLSSQFRVEGARYWKMTEEQREQLEAQDPAAEQVDFAAEDIDKLFFNKDTTRFIWRSLMEEGIREATGSHVGKTIVFARNHVHALHLAEVFSELYPQYGSTFCRVIDNQEPRADQLIDDFKKPDSELTIAISVDMLDTGIDVPEVVNLVLARPVKSYVKFWQMIGRGTRLRKNLFGPGRDKTEFLVFDLWSNFWYFDEKYKETQPSPQKSLLQQLFEARVELAQVALDRMDSFTFEAAAALIIGDVRAARDTNSIDARDKWRELEMLADGDRVHHFAAATKSDLLSIAAPLQHLRNIRGDEDAYRFDLLMTRLEVELVRGGPSAPKVQDLRARVQEAVELLAKNQNPVRALAEPIQQVRSREFWASVEVHQLEGLRRELRGIMKYQQLPPVTRVAPQVFDVDDADFSATTYIPRLEGLDLVEYKRRVEAVLRERLAENPTLQRIRAGGTVREEELEELARLVLEVDDKANVKHLVGHDPETRSSLLTVFRGLVGLDAAAVERAFTAFVHKHPRLSSQQLRFLQAVQNHIAQNGSIEIERLYEPPFTTLHAESVDGIFTEPGAVDEFLAILSTFEPKRAAPGDRPPTSQAS
ncbi:DEAD/DEAH box helicase family protein [Pyxidicoccus xibeiensis]|uniref:DEAD/DEAH box helicase family protein n=1 Tax=Pyxidicoccus xibeiensis TaxID=2906759 RepID=UPI0020A81B54|nr:DEAD/DEAH box helicase family protein [Pyxidicoccus xibeiensis]MCP3143431.1 DEAD/DEAH box helicase family protein [Pyxidicoccus xibeiensis]